MQPLCHMLIGPPAAGKTTFAQQCIAETPGLTWVSTDRIRQQLYGDEAIQGDWPSVEAIALGQIREAIVSGSSVIYDATNARPEWRRSFLAQAAPFTTALNSPWLAWLLLPPLEVCLERNRERSRQVPEAAIAASHASLTAQPPTLQEGFISVTRLWIEQPRSIDWQSKKL